MSDIVRAKGIILSSMPIGDNDNRIVILTAELGKITAIARGSRRQGNHLAGLVRPFLMAEFELFPRRDGYQLSGGTSIDYFEALTSDIDRLYYGFYFLEIADYYGREGIGAKDSLNLLYFTFKALIDAKMPYQLIRRIYEFKSMVHAGEYPDVTGCCKCGDSEPASMYYSSWNQRFICDKCLKGEVRYADAYAVSKDLLYTLRYIAASRTDKLYSFVLSDAVMKELDSWVEKQAKLTMDKRFKSLEVLDGLKVLDKEVLTRE